MYWPRSSGPYTTFIMTSTCIISWTTGPSPLLSVVNTLCKPVTSRDTKYLGAYRGTLKTPLRHLRPGMQALLLTCLSNSQKKKKKKRLEEKVGRIQSPRLHFSTLNYTRPGKSARHRLFLVASRTDLPNIPQPVDILLAHQWDGTGLNMRQLRPGLLGLSDFRNHIAAALIPSTVWNNPELSFLKRFKGARFFDQLGKT